VLLSVNVAEDKPAAATSVYDTAGTYAAGKATDGDTSTRWASRHPVRCPECGPNRRPRPRLACLQQAQLRRARPTPPPANSATARPIPRPPATAVDCTHSPARAA
jgi:hypothetical protein